MPYAHKYADQIKIGDILAPTLSHGVMSVKEVYSVDNPVTGEKEIVIKGPLNITDKMHPKAPVKVCV